MHVAPQQLRLQQQQQQRQVSAPTSPRTKSPPSSSLSSHDARKKGESAKGETHAPRRSLKTHVTSTISSSLHILADEVSARSPASLRMRRRSASNRTSEASPPADEPALTHARPPASREEVEGQLERILYAINQLQQLQQRGQYIASTEVLNLRRAFLFAVGEELRYRDTRDECGSTSSSACVSGPTTPSLVAQDPPSKGTTLPTALAVTAATQEEAVCPAEASVPMEGKRNYSPKATAADRLLTALEQYVAENPNSTSFDVRGARFSWRSVIRTPGERRLQSLIISGFIFFTGIPICLVITTLLLLSRYTAPLMVMYLIWMLTFGRPNHPQQKNLFFTRCFLWRYYRDYFPVRLVVPKPVRRRIDKERNYFFVYHPHGIHSFGALVNFGMDRNNTSKLLNGITIHLQTLSINFYVPLWRQLSIWMGCGDASASCIRKTLRSGAGQSIMLVVGGAEEALMAKPNRNDLLLFKRKGFIKIALQEGTPLVPVYGFGENNVYGVMDLTNEPWIQCLLKLCKQCVGFVVPLIRGRGFFHFNYGPLPHRSPIVVVVGEPLEVPHIPNPTKEDLDVWQGKYIECLRKLYNDHRGIYDLESTGLRIME